MEINGSNDPFVQTMAQQYQSRVQARDSSFEQSQEQQAVEKQLARDQQLTSDVVASMHTPISIYA